MMAQSVTAQPVTVLTLEQKIDERIREAKEKDIFGKAETIAKVSGAFGPDNTLQYIFEDPTMRIYFDAAPPASFILAGELCDNIQIVSGSVVFSGRRTTYFDRNKPTGLEIKAYIPGTWTTVLDGFYDKAKAIQEGRERAQTIRRYIEIQSRKDEKDLSRAPDFGFFD